MNVLPETRMGRVAVWLLLPVLLYPLYWSVFLLIPDSWRALSIGVVAVIVGLAVASLLTAAVAVVRRHERSVAVLGLGGLTLLMVVFFAVGEAVGGH
ncbi:hypothetical protein [Nocardioides marmoribigeumensis]|uniref:Glucose dehydrogenase n=1 Tax=Nocardioides marmoribigeumensis TaxID=433649 RepID=A0ABU2BUF2_9ACTN|nr:hypothetical protein [Nocardioides marmoribigeumensis]MDR7361901.1 glucose dehydrogenase [Nocardioides marmoribigeumensis]